MDAKELWERAAEAQEAQRRAEQAGDVAAAKRAAHMVSVFTRLAERRANA